MVNGSGLGEVANWKGGMGAHCQSDLQGSWASEKKLVKYARDMKYSSYLCCQNLPRLSSDSVLFWSNNNYFKVKGYDTDDDTQDVLYGTVCQEWQGGQ